MKEKEKERKEDVVVNYYKLPKLSNEFDEFVINSVEVLSSQN